MNPDWMSKNARPFIVILGGIVFALNYCIIPIICRFMGKDFSPFVIPDICIVGYFSLAGIYSVARSFDKNLLAKFEPTKEEPKA
jgi:hypothetical protein